MGGDAAFRLVCDNPLLAVDVLGGPQSASLRDVMTTVVATRDLPRFLRRLASLGANVEYAYTGANEGPASIYLVIGVATTTVSQSDALIVVSMSRICCGL